VSPFPISPWRGALGIKHRDNFIFTVCRTFCIRQALNEYGRTERHVHVGLFADPQESARFSYE
jgi:hypothetical protein